MVYVMLTSKLSAGSRLTGFISIRFPRKKDSSDAWPVPFPLLHVPFIDCNRRKRLFSVGALPNCTLSAPDIAKHASKNRIIHYTEIIGNKSDFYFQSLPFQQKS